MKDMKDKKKEIVLGDISMWNWEVSKGLFPKYILDDEEEAEYIKKTTPDEVIFPANQLYKLRITYPLSYPYCKKFTTSEKGMTRIEFVQLCVEAYQSIYAEEERTTKGKKNPIDRPFERGLLNRPTTKGRFGIWGHSLDDLVLHTAYLKEDTGEITLGVDS